jgi:hypothetical protein
MSRQQSHTFSLHTQQIKKKKEEKKGEEELLR